jgi:signal transduction histidine kinase
MYLQEHLADRSKLNQRLQAQIAEYRRIEAIEKEERALTEALRNTLATMSTTLDLDKILDHILDTIKQITPYDGANVMLLESDLVHVVRQRGYATPNHENGASKRLIPVSALAILQQLVELGKPVAIPDTATSPMWIGFPDFDWVNSNVIAPIRSENRILGFLSLDSATPGFFSQPDADKLQVFADQVAIAIQNARLLERAKHSAVIAERSRLASEMHDTISQTLWSMSLITERLPAIWEIDRDEGERSLRTLGQLAQTALVEMRALLLELHPTSLTDASPGDLIRQAAEIITNRTGLNISVEIREQEPVPSDVHIVLYRVVQEALNNVAHHASASHVEVVFNSQRGRLDLSIQDNGLGFNQAEVGLDRLGLSIMNDRVQSIGGTLEVQSSKGQGTLIKFSWAAPTN